MESFCHLFVFLGLLMSISSAATLRLDGDLKWRITQPDCTFSLEGGIQNVSSDGSTSGTVKLVLFATQNPYPSAGFNIGEYTLGQISSGFQFSDFTVRTTSKVPKISGDFHFTIAVLEFTSSGWRTQLVVRSEPEKLVAGNFLTQLKWFAPSAEIIKAKPRLKKGEKVILTPLATDLMNLLPVVDRENVTLQIREIPRLVAAGDAGRHPAEFTYRIRKSPYREKRVENALWLVNYNAAGNDSPTSESKIALYFQSPSGGVYRNSSEDNFGNRVTWGTFRIE